MIRHANRCRARGSRDVDDGCGFGGRRAPVRLISDAKHMRAAVPREDRHGESTVCGQVPPLLDPLRTGTFDFGRPGRCQVDADPTRAHGRRLDPNVHEAVLLIARGVDGLDREGRVTDGLVRREVLAGQHPLVHAQVIDVALEARLAAIARVGAHDESSRVEARLEEPARGGADEPALDPQPREAPGVGMGGEAHLVPCAVPERRERGRAVEPDGAHLAHLGIAIPQGDMLTVDHEGVRTAVAVGVALLEDDRSVRRRRVGFPADPDRDAEIRRARVPHRPRS